jgi:LacI family transcriptional regulator
MATIKDIAREAGYSVSTVSRVLSGHPDVSGAARSRIMEVVEARHFVVNRNAANLKRQSTRTIVLVIKGRSNMLFQSILEFIQADVTEAGYAVAVEYVDEDADEVVRAAALAREAKPEGILFLGGEKQHLRDSFGQIGLPAVVVTDSAEGLGFPDLSSVSGDDVAGGRRAMDHLLDHGHRAIGIVGGKAGVSTTSRLRLDGAVAALAERSVPFDPNRQVEAARYSLAEGYRATMALLDRFADLTALFCMSDIQAIGAIRALQDRGRSVPLDVSVMGFDGTELSDYTTPRLSTIHQYRERLAARSVEILLSQLHGEPGGIHELLPSTLKKGESVRALDG